MDIIFDFEREKRVLGLNLVPLGALFWEKREKGILSLFPIASDLRVRVLSLRGVQRATHRQLRDCCKSKKMSTIAEKQERH